MSRTIYFNFYNSFFCVKYCPMSKLKKSKKSHFVFKYNKQNCLYSYVERDMSQNLLSLYTYNYKNHSMIRYDKENKLRIFVQFDEPCKLVQNFEAGESWVKSVPEGQSVYQHNNPKIKKQFALNNENQIVRFGFQQYLTSGMVKI